MIRAFIIILIQFILLVACTAAPTATPAPTPTATAAFIPSATLTALPTATATRTATATPTNTPPPPTATKTPEPAKPPTPDVLAIPNYEVAPFPPGVDAWGGRIEWDKIPPGQTFQELSNRLKTDPRGFIPRNAFYKYTEKVQFDRTNRGEPAGVSVQFISAYGFEVLRGWSTPHDDGKGNQIIEAYVRTRNAKGELVTIRLTINRNGKYPLLLLNVPIGGIYYDECCRDLFRENVNIFQPGDALLVGVAGVSDILNSARPDVVTTWDITGGSFVSYPFSYPVKK